MKRVILFLLFLPLMNMYGQLEGPIISNRWDNFYIGLSGGGAYILSDNIKEYNIMNMVKPSFSFSVGKYFNPIIGMRIEGVYHNYRNGASRELVNYFPEVFGDGLYTFRSFGFYGDMLININNIISSKNEMSKFYISGIVGIGTLKSSNFSKNVNEWKWTADAKDYRYPINTNTPFYFSCKFGLQLNYRVSKFMDLNLEGDFVGITNGWEGVKSDSKFDGFLLAHIGATYFFKSKNKRYNAFIRKKNHTLFNEKINSEYKKNDSIFKVIDKKTERNSIVDKTIFPEILFLENQTEVSASQYNKLKFISDYLDSHPGETLYIIGYGNQDIGNIKKNKKIVDKRMKNVCDMLVDNYKILRDRFLFISKKNNHQNIVIDEHTYNKVTFIIKPRY